MTQMCLCLNRRMEVSGTVCGEYVLVHQMRKMDEEQSLRYFKMFKCRFDDLLCWISSKTPTVILLEFHRDRLQFYGSSGSSQQCVAPVAPQSYPFCEPMFFFPRQQVQRCFISEATTECPFQSTNVRQVKRCLRHYKF